LQIARRGILLQKQAAGGDTSALALTESFAPASTVANIHQERNNER
jgi:hypothetical protein